jgi:hypothetical protein
MQAPHTETVMPHSVGSPVPFLGHDAFQVGSGI